MKLFYFFIFCFTNGEVVSACIYLKERMFFFFYKILLLSTLSASSGINSTKGQLHLEFSGEMLLRFVFHPNYNYYMKSCCKFTSYGCIIFVTSNGYVHYAYEGRIETYKYSGTFDVRIWNVHAKDTGTYRCEIHGTQKHIYQDFQVVIAGKALIN